MLSQIHSRHAVELNELNEQLLEAESMRATYEKEVIASLHQADYMLHFDSVALPLQSVYKRFIIVFLLSIQTALLKEKLEQYRQESAVENEEAIVEARRTHEREKHLLLEDTKRVVAELERVIFFHLRACKLPCLQHRFVGPVFRYVPATSVGEAANGRAIK